MQDAKNRTAATRNGLRLYAASIMEEYAIVCCRRRLFRRERPAETVVWSGGWFLLFLFLLQNEVGRGGLYVPF